MVMRCNMQPGYGTSCYDFWPVGFWLFGGLFNLNWWQAPRQPALLFWAPILRGWNWKQSPGCSILQLYAFWQCTWIGQYHLCFTEMWWSLENKAFWVGIQWTVTIVFIYLFCQCLCFPYAIFMVTKTKHLHLLCKYIVGTQLIFCQWISKWIENGYFEKRSPFVCFIYINSRKLILGWFTSRNCSIPLDSTKEKNIIIEKRQNITMPIWLDIHETSKSASKCDELEDRREFLEKSQLCFICPFSGAWWIVPVHLSPRASSCNDETAVELTGSCRKKL